MLSRLSSFIALLSLVTPAQASETPRVVVSIAPIHSLVAGVMEGVAEPALLVSGNNSPHSYMLKPSQMRSLQQADLIVWVGDSVETFLSRSLATVTKNKVVIELMAMPGMTLLPAREGGLWGDADEQITDEGHDHSSIDGHIWLDPENAKVIVKVLVRHLSDLDPQHRQRYVANGERLQQQLTELDQELKNMLAPLRQRPYLVFHDAYQYFERRYQLQSLAAIMATPEHKPGASRLRDLRQQIQQQELRCVFSEPQFSANLLQTLTQGTALRHATLDPMGSSLAPGKTLYFELMRKLEKDLVECLEGKL